MTTPARVVLVSDPHIGAHHAWAPPGTPSRMPSQRRSIDGKMRCLRDRRPDVAIFMGDLIDGPNKRAGGRGVWTVDCGEQAAAATDFIRLITGKNRACSIYIVRGTPYHVGTDTDWEDVIARDVGANILSRGWVEVDGVNFDVRHKISRSTVPQGRATALLREELWAQRWAYRHQHPSADILVRGHAHYYLSVQIWKWLGIICPMTCGLGSDYAVRECSDEVDFGWVEVECLAGRYTHSGDRYIWGLEVPPDTILKHKGRIK